MTHEQMRNVEFDLILDAPIPTPEYKLTFDSYSNNDLVSKSKQLRRLLNDHVGPQLGLLRDSSTRFFTAQNDQSLKTWSVFQSLMGYDVGSRVERVISIYYGEGWFLVKEIDWSSRRKSKSSIFKTHVFLNSAVDAVLFRLVQS